MAVQAARKRVSATAAKSIRGAREVCQRARPERPSRVRRRSRRGAVPECCRGVRLHVQGQRLAGKKVGYIYRVYRGLVGYIYRGRIHTNWLYIFLDWHHLERLIEDNSSRLLADRDRGARCWTNWAQKVVNHGLSHTFSLPAGFMNGGVPPVRARMRAAIPAPLRQPRAPKLPRLAAAPGAVGTPWPPTHDSAPAMACVRAKVAVSYSSWCGYSRSDAIAGRPWNQC